MRRPITNRLEDIDTYFLALAHLVSLRSTCRRRRVGCVLVDQKRRVRATGYNGVPKGYPHCLDTPCPGADAPSGTQLSECYSVHAEINALIQFTNFLDDPITAYLTTTPCRDCTKVLSNSPVTRIVAATYYSQEDAVIYQMLEAAGISCEVRGFTPEDLISQLSELYRGDD